MRNALRLALFAAVAASLVGCRFKGFESFSAATTPGTGTQRGGTNDPFGNGGIADATGGQNAATRYGAGAKPGGKPLPGYDQPQKGSGQMRGEYPNVAAPGYGQTNAPAFQPSPSDVGQSNR